MGGKLQSAGRGGRSASPTSWRCTARFDEISRPMSSARAWQWRPLRRPSARVRGWTRRKSRQRVLFRPEGTHLPPQHSRPSRVPPTGDIPRIPRRVAGNPTMECDYARHIGMLLVRSACWFPSTFKESSGYASNIAGRLIENEICLFGRGGGPRHPFPALQRDGTAGSPSSSASQQSRLRTVTAHRAHRLAGRPREGAPWRGPLPAPVATA